MSDIECPYCGRPVVLVPDPRATEFDRDHRTRCYFCRELHSVDKCVQCGGTHVDGGSICNNCLIENMQVAMHTRPRLKLTQHEGGDGR